MKSKRTMLLSFVAVLVLSLQFIAPIAAYADDETPPPSTEEVATPDPGETVLDAASTPPPAETEPAPVETEPPLPPAEPTEPSAEPAAQEPTVLEALQALPAQTTVVVLDESGEPQPLASEEAAEIIADSDPMWCPTGKLPGDAGCTSSKDTVAELITELQIIDWTGPPYPHIYSGSGTIYFTSTYFTNDATFDGVALNNLSNLTLQGGWNGFNNDAGFALSGNTTFTVPVQINNWSNGTFTINNITFSNSGGIGLAIDIRSGTSTVVINNSEFTGNRIGLEPYARDTYSETDGAGTINLTVNNSKFDNNTSYAILALTSGRGKINLTLNCDQFTNNAKDFAKDGTVTLTDNPCPTEEPPPPPPPCTGYNCSPIIIPVDSGSIEFSIDCSLFNSFIPVWPNGDQVLITCVPGGTARVSRVDNTSLPGSLGTGYTYASGFVVEITQNGVPLSIMPEGGYIQPSFVADENNVPYGISYWGTGSSDWLLLDPFQLNPNGIAMKFASFGSQDARTILKGTLFIPGNPNREEVTTNFPGTYVLVEQD